MIRVNEKKNKEYNIDKFKFVLDDDGYIIRIFERKRTNYKEVDYYESDHPMTEGEFENWCDAWYDSSWYDNK